MVTITQVSIELGVSRTTVRNLILTGKLPAMRVGKTFRIRKEDYETFNRESVVVSQ